MLSKLYLMQKLQRKMKQCDDLNDAIGPMMKIVKAEKNKLMIQRLEIESQLRKLGRDPAKIVADMKSGKKPASSPKTSNQTDFPTLGSSLADEPLLNSEESLAPAEDGLENFLSELSLDLNKTVVKTSDFEEEEEDSDDNSVDEFVSNDGVYVEDNQENIEDILQKFVATKDSD